jgi:hypothetical protein
MGSWSFLIKILFPFNFSWRVLSIWIHFGISLQDDFGSLFDISLLQVRRPQFEVLAFLKMCFLTSTVILQLSLSLLPQKSCERL